MVEDDQVRKQLGNQSVGQHYRSVGFVPHHPVALFNSLCGNVIEVVESQRKPEWENGALWVDLSRVTAAVLGNVTGAGHTNTAAARVQRWQDELMHMMDTDRDGDIDAEELLSFLMDTATLQDDRLIQKICQEAEGKSTLQLLKELGPAMPKVLAALVTAKSQAEQDPDAQPPNTGLTGTAARSSKRTIEYHWEASTEFAKHMQLAGYKDPEGIKVRPRAGLESMECLVANDPGGLMAKLGAALMLPVTTALRQVGYKEGTTMRGYSYDWRMPCTKLEERDQYMSKTMEDIADLVRTNDGKKAVVISHSLGGVTASYFFHWVAHSDYGKAHGGVQWLKDNIHAFVPLAGPMLGTPYGSHAYLTGDEEQGLAPMVFSYADRHLVIRSWAMFGMIFPTGRHLMLQPTHSVHWVRQQGCLNVHVISVQLQGFQETETDSQQFYVMLGFQEPVTGKIPKKRKCTPFPLSTTGAIDEHFQFYWGPHPDKIDNAALTLELWRDWVGPIDKKIGKGTLELNCDKVTVEGHHGGGFPGLKPNEYVEFEFPLAQGNPDGVTVSVKASIKFVPWNENEMHHDFRRPDDQDPGAFRCGGLADACSSQEKRDRLLQALGSEEGKEWRPEPKKKDQGIAYAPMSVDQMMVIDEMEENYATWKHCYADDPIWRQYSTEAPAGVNRIRPVYGINKATVVGNVYYRENTKIVRYQPNSSLSLDTTVEIDHPCYNFNKGKVEEVPHKTPQADDPTVPLSEMTYNTKASGDETVAYWSLRWPITWKKQGFDVEVVEVEGAGHRDILEKTACLETCLSEACSTPIQYIEIVLEGVTYHAKKGCSCCYCCYVICCLPLYCCCKCFRCCTGIGADTVFVGLKWRNQEYVSEPVAGRGERKIESSRRFVLGVNQQDFDQDKTIDLSIHQAVQSGTSRGPVAENTKVVSMKISELFKQKDSGEPQKVPMGERSNSGHTIKWRWRWYAADDTGKPNFSS